MVVMVAKEKSVLVTNWGVQCEEQMSKLFLLLGVIVVLCWDVVISFMVGGEIWSYKRIGGGVCRVLSYATIE
jgi:hypothetical protein